MGDSPCIPIFTDNNVPDSVGNTFASVGHNVVRLRMCMPKDTADPVVGIACVKSGRVLVTHDKDFRAISRRLDITQREYRGMHRITLLCEFRNSASRIKDAMSLIEHEWHHCQHVSNRKLWIEINEVAFRTIRWMGT